MALAFRKTARTLSRIRFTLKLREPLTRSTQRGIGPLLGLGSCGQPSADCHPAAPKLRTDLHCAESLVREPADFAAAHDNPWTAADLPSRFALARPARTRSLILWRSCRAIHPRMAITASRNGPMLSRYSPEGSVADAIAGQQFKVS